MKNSHYNDVIHCGGKFAVYFQTAIDMLPQEILDFAINNVAIICLSNMDACRVAREIAKQREIILVSERILPLKAEKLDSEVITYFIFVIFHEIAHAYSKHKSPRYSLLTESENFQQETEADKLALDWYNAYVLKINNPNLKKLDLEIIEKLRKESFRKLEALNS